MKKIKLLYNKQSFLKALKFIRSPYWNATGLTCAFCIENDIIRIVCIWIVLIEIFKEKNVINATKYILSKPMQVEKINFTSEKVMSDAINHQFDEKYKINMLSKRIDNLINNWRGDDLSDEKQEALDSLKEYSEKYLKTKL